MKKNPRRRFKLDKIEKSPVFPKGWGEVKMSEEVKDWGKKFEGLKVTPPKEEKTIQQLTDD